MKLQVNRIAYPVTVLGPGRRLGIWVQGCSIHCPGCGSVDTWAPDGGEAKDVEALSSEIADIMVEEKMTGLTITGGEPTEQAESLVGLIDRMRFKLEALDAEPVDVLVFSGRSARTVKTRALSLWTAADAFICGPYRPDRPGDRPLLASSNQKLFMLTSLGRKRFSGVGKSTERFLQAHVEDGEITLIGLPGSGDLERLEEVLTARGIQIGGTSWRTL
jgi:anaerobic ribonucleoside-triphosphate reductase activating protein